MRETSQRISHPRIKDLRYPTTDIRPESEDWHGTTVTDDYAWLQRSDNSVKEWEEKQNKLTRQYLDSLEYRTEIRDGLEKWIYLDKVGCPFTKGEKLFQWKRKGKENHYVLYVGKDLDNQHVVIDPNKLSEDGTTAIDWTSITKDGKFLVYGVSEGGSEQSILKIRDIDAGKDLLDTIPNTRHSSVSWLPDYSGFYYSRLPQKGAVPQGEEHYGRKVFFHRLGDDWRTDELIFDPKDPYDSHPSMAITKDGEWAKLYVSHGWKSNDVYVARIKEGSIMPEFKPLAVGDDGHFSLTRFGEYFYIKTDFQAPNFKVMRVRCTEDDISDKTKWDEFIPEQDNVLSNFKIVGGRIVLNYQMNACSQLEIMNLDLSDRQEISLPTLGTVISLTGENDNPDMYYSFESYAIPNSIYKFNVETNKQTRIDGLSLDVDLSQITTEQITYRSKDGTPVTMFVVKNKSCSSEGNNKAILYGYGGFRKKMTPSFSGNIVDWVNSGGIYAVPNLRGGSEYGEDWHRAGMQDKKQNVFDDFIAAAEYLIDSKYTKPEKLAIWGGSNGGLLVGAVMVQRPELFGAVVCTVPLLDMIHYDQLKIAKFWMSEYGDPSNPEHFKFLYTYSPYHQVVDGKNYPPIFLISAENDSRVDSMHARKMAAKLQAATASTNPVLLYIEDNAGHGAGKPAIKILESGTDIYTFLRSTIGSDISNI
jgi:prolyl oligopeptidase